VSAYPKLRISEKQIISMLEKYNFKITHAKVINRMIFVVAEK
jgi:hypothetical protein